MSKFLSLVFLLIGLAGCGSGGGGSKSTPPTNPISDHPILDGTYFAIIGSYCGFGLTFDSSKNTLVTQYICELDDGTYNAEVEVGPYSIYGNTITFHSEKQSCADSYDETYTITFNKTNSGAIFEVDGVILSTVKYISDPVTNMIIRLRAVIAACSARTVNPNRMLY